MTTEQKIKDKIQSLRQSLALADTFAMKAIANKIGVLEGFLNNFRAYGMKAVEKETEAELKELLGIDDELDKAAKERIGIYSSLSENMQNAILEEIKAIFLSHKNIDFTDATKMPLLDLKHEELLSLRCCLKDMKFKSWQAWLDGIDRLDKELLRRCVKHLPLEQQAIMVRLL